MERSIKVTSEGDTLVIDVDGKAKAFSRDKGITAQDFFEAFRYRPRDKYAITKGDPGKIPQDVFNSFFELVNEVVSGINGLCEPEEILEVEE